MSNSIKVKTEQINCLDLKIKNNNIPVNRYIIVIDLLPVNGSMNYVNQNDKDLSLSINLTKKTARDLINKIKKELDK